MAVKAPKVVASKFKGTTHVTFVLDRSGSMLKIKDQVIDGFNDWLSSLALAAKGAGGGFPVTVVLFNTTVDVPVDGVSVGDVNPLDSTRYVCRGNTALNDALVEHGSDPRHYSGERGRRKLDLHLPLRVSLRVPRRPVVWGARGEHDVLRR
jgi:hypothetical protein